MCRVYVCSFDFVFFNKRKLMRRFNMIIQTASSVFNVLIVNTSQMTLRELLLRTQL